MDSQQEIFSALLVNLESKGYTVYDGCLPPRSVPYPFIYLADSQQIEENTKGAVIGNVFQTIHVYHDRYTERGTLSGIMLDIKRSCREIDETENHNWMVVNINQNILADNTTQTPLLHGIIEVEFKYS